MKNKSPILFLTFNRKEEALKVFEQIKKYEPNKLYLNSDGPRDNEEEYKLVYEIRELILKNVDWNCEVQTRFNSVNLGCKDSINSAIDWFFSKEEFGIILEDDCLPANSFFDFCHKNLLKHKDNLDILIVSGNNFDEELNLKNDCDQLTSYPFIWGWATWKNRWEDHRNNFPYRLKKINWIKFLKNSSLLNIWTNAKRAEKGIINTWDYQLIFTSYWKSSKNLYPRRNLIKNIGFNSVATHTHHIRKELIVSYTEIPNYIPKHCYSLNSAYDRYVYKKIFRWNRIHTFKKFIKYILIESNFKIFSKKKFHIENNV